MNTVLQMKSLIPESAREEPRQRLNLMPGDYDLIPEVWVYSVSSVLFATVSLAWDYAGTILDECARLKLPYKQNCRNVRKLMDSYRHMRWLTNSTELEKKETENGYGIEEICKNHLNAVNILARNLAVRKKCSHLQDQFSAVAQCVTVTTAACAMATLADMKITDMFCVPIPQKKMLLPNEVIFLHKYVSSFVPPGVWAELRPHVRTAAKVMTETLASLEIENLEIWRLKPFRKWTPQEERAVMLDVTEYTDAQRTLCIGRSERAFLNKQKELTEKLKIKN